ncbi:M23 family metallopeptidase [Halobacteriovorax marinus]|uniref:M23 family metallopeptidase n=1 Tax=Halobacteriovorax marinus TaxID=97084 RepID=UPI003A8E1977
MKKRNLLFALPLVATIQANALANPSIYLWDNQEGFVPAANCKISPSENTPFRVSSFTGWKSSETENLRNYNGIRQSHLINGSIVKTIDGKKKNNYEKIEVVGINKNSDARVNRWFSQRLDQGYLYSKSVLPIEDYVIEVENTNFPQEQKNILSNHNSTYWLAEASGSYYKLNCPGKNEGRDYTLFRVYNTLSENTAPSSFVGVYFDESKVFKDIRTTPISKIGIELVDTETTYDLEEILSNEDNQFIENEDLLTSTEEFKIEVAKNDEIERKTTTSNKDSGLINKEAPVGDVKGTFEDVVCVPSNTLNVRDESLEKVIFKSQTGEKVKKFQSFETEEKEITLDGVVYNFIKVQFSNREEKDQTVGWVASKYIKKKSQCKYLRSEEEMNVIRDVEISGLDDPKCCEFPTVKAPTHSYTSGMRMFKARRGGGSRSHAACDLYRYKDEPILSVAPGVVVRDLYYFYQGTYALEVRHSGGFIVRYGELTGKKESGVSSGKKVKMGQRVGYMGKVNSNCCRPMLHFELFDGSGRGSLSQKGNKFQRRSDLMDPTHYLQKWESGKF